MALSGGTVASLSGAVASQCGAVASPGGAAASPGGAMASPGGAVASLDMAKDKRAWSKSSELSWTWAGMRCLVACVIITSRWLSSHVIQCNTFPLDTFQKMIHSFTDCRPGHVHGQVHVVNVLCPYI